MKKVMCLLLIGVTLLLNVKQAEALPVSPPVEPVTVSALVAALVSVGITCYTNAPNAEYLVTPQCTDGCTYIKATSCTEAITAAIQALEKGAKYVNIRSANHTTIHSTCNDKTYYQGDISYLRSRL
jgi:hypothetical protein